MANKRDVQIARMQIAAEEAARREQYAREDAERQRLLEQAAAQEAKKAAEAEAAKIKRQGDITSSREIAGRNALDTLAQWGISTDGDYDERIDQLLDDAIRGLGDAGDPYTLLNGRNVANEFLTNQQTQERNALTRQANEQFGANYANNLIGGNLLDSVVADIIGEQRGEAQAYLDRGMARGIYNDTGYGAGQNKLNTQAQAGMSQVRSAADDVLNSYRSQANTVRDKAYGAASGFTLGSNINLDDYVGEGNTIRDRAMEFGGGDLRNVLGGQQFFDFSGLTNAAGMAQGATNLRDSNIAAALAARKDRATAGRGLGSQGVF